MFSFCKPVSSKKRFLPHRKLNEKFSFTLFDKAGSLPSQEWSAIVQNKNIFLNLDYLKIIERGEYAKLICRYVLVYENNKVCGIIYFQIIDFKAGVLGDLFNRQVQETKSGRLNLFEKYIDANKQETLMRLFTCGNNLVSGEYGFLFDKKIKQEEANALALKITDVIAKEEKIRNTISAILIKDFELPLSPKKLLKEEKFNEFFVEPNLIVNIPSGVKSMEDYLGIFSKKYRNRAKSIFKSAGNLEIKELDLDQIKAQEEQLYQLYENIFDKAKFKLIKLPKNYFSEVKTVYPDKFFVKVFLSNNRLLAFASYFLMPDASLEAHYIGLNYEKNQEHELYQNILYLMINEAIKHHLQKVNLGRTAAEIKTTVGAKPHDLICYIKPQNTISKIIQKPFISFLQPAEWTPRNPFKEENA